MPKLDVMCRKIWNVLKVDIDNGLTRDALQSTKHRLKLFSPADLWSIKYLSTLGCCAQYSDSGTLQFLLK